MTRMKMTPETKCVRASSNDSSPSSSSSMESMTAEEKRLVTSAKRKDDAVTRDAIEALVASYDVRGKTNDEFARAFTGTWRLIHSTKSAFDARAPLGRRTDATAPGIEALFAAMFGDDDAKANARDGSSSPIQRAVLNKALDDDDGFAVLQGVRLTGEAAKTRVDQVVRFGDGFGYFRLSAKASLEPESSPRRGRINYAFDNAYVRLKKPFDVRLPYPVPFKLLGDEARGYLDLKYASDVVRVVKGNKGTTFAFVREDSLDALPCADDLFAS